MKQISQTDSDAVRSHVLVISYELAGCEDGNRIGIGFRLWSIAHPFEDNIGSVLDAETKSEMLEALSDTEISVGREITDVDALEEIQRCCAAIRRSIYNA